MELLERIKSLIDCPVRVAQSKVVEALSGKNILIYGAGSFGREMLALLKRSRIDVKAFLDVNAKAIGSVDGTAVYRLEDYDSTRENTVVIFSIVCDKDLRRTIIDGINAAGFECVIEAQSIRCLSVCFTESYNGKTAFGQINKAYSLLSDQKSREIFLNNIYAHFSGDYSCCEKYEEPMSEQYFPENIPFAKDYSVFVDCGGYIGDTAEAVLKKYKPKKVVSFEPFIGNYKKMSENCAKYKGSGTEFYLYNNAVSDKTKLCCFAEGTGSGSLSDSGEITVVSVSLDQALPCFRPTFIKMDIEGEEYNAIIGASEIIRDSMPDMAICVYHSIDDIWRLPLLIDSIKSGYSYYLRSYNSYTMETVLYAVKRSEA